MLANAGIGCVRADACRPSEFWLDDAQSDAIGITAEVEHPSWGPYRRHGSNVTFDGELPKLHPPPLAGQHNAELLADLGYSHEQVEQLKLNGTIWSETDE